MIFVKTFALYLIFGKPLFAYFGLLTLVSLLFTAAISTLNKKGIRVIPFKWHAVMARVTIVLALIHTFLALSLFL